MTELMTPATLLGPMWFSGSIERGRLSLHQGHVWFESGTLVQREPGHLWFQHHPTSKNDIVVPVEKVRAKTPWFTWGCGLRLHALADGYYHVYRFWLGSVRNMAGRSIAAATPSRPATPSRSLRRPGSRLRGGDRRCRVGRARLQRYSASVTDERPARPIGGGERFLCIIQGPACGRPPAIVRPAVYR